MISSSFGKIANEQGEIVAEGACEVDDGRGSVTLRPILDMPLLERQHGTLRLFLDDGSELLLTDRVIHFRVNLPGQRPGSIYRMFIAHQQGLNRWSTPQGTISPETGSVQGSEHDPSRDPDALPPEFRKDGPT